jgi:hypothetical protein
VTEYEYTNQRPYTPDDLIVERRVRWPSDNPPPGVIRKRAGKVFLDERELTDDLVRELGGVVEERLVTEWGVVE